MADAFANGANGMKSEANVDFIDAEKEQHTSSTPERTADDNQPTEVKE